MRGVESQGQGNEPLEQTPADHPRQSLALPLRHWCRPRRSLIASRPAAAEPTVGSDRGSQEYLCNRLLPSAELHDSAAPRSDFHLFAPGVCIASSPEVPSLPPHLQKARALDRLPEGYRWASGTVRSRREAQGDVVHAFFASWRPNAVAPKRQVLQARQTYPTQPRLLASKITSVYPVTHPAHAHAHAHKARRQPHTLASMLISAIIIHRYSELTRVHLQKARVSFTPLQSTRPPTNEHCRLPPRHLCLRRPEAA